VTHSEFVASYGAGRVTVTFDPKESARFLSARLMLPFFMLPVLGAGVALALVGYIWLGLSVIAVGIIAPRLIKSSAPHFLLTQMMNDAKLYDDCTRAGIMRVERQAQDQNANPFSHG
jgi:hypothetical protein